MANLNPLDNVIKEIIKSIEKSKSQIFEITENNREEYFQIKIKLKNITKRVQEAIQAVDRLEKEENQARFKLMQVSKDFKRYGENEIKMAYDNALVIKENLIVKRAEEKFLRYQRDELENSLKRTKDSLDRAEALMSHINVILNFFNSSLQDINDKLAEAQQLQNLGVSIIWAQEEERRRVAREIHDGPAQAMANIVMRAEFILKLLTINPTMVANEVISLKDLVRLCLQDIRKIIFDLRPMVLDDLGLIPALNKYLEDFRKQNQIVLKFIHLGPELRFESSLEVAAFRIIQEALNNILKHAQASQVNIKVELLPERINVSIKDNGTGFDVKSVLDDKSRPGCGLIGMRERIQLLKGDLTLLSAKGKGTEIIFWLPTK